MSLTLPEIKSSGIDFRSPWAPIEELDLIQFNLWRKPLCSALRAPAAFRWSTITAGAFDGPRREFAFRGLLTCAYDNCAVTAEIKKNKYTYYRCTGSRGKCDLPYMREEELGEKLGQTLKDIYIPDGVLAQLESLLRSDTGRQETLQRRERGRLEKRLGFVRHRFEQAYMDKLDGKISEEFWERKAAE